MQEKNFYSVVFVIWPIIGAVIGVFLMCALDFVSGLFTGRFHLFKVFGFLVYGSVFFYKYYLWVGVPLAFLSRFFSSDGRILLVFFTPLFAGFVISWLVAGKLFGPFFYITFGVGWLNVFFFLWALPFLKKRGLVIPDNKKQIS